MKTLPHLDLAKFAFDGQAVLRKLLQESTYGSLEQAVASLASFAHPQTVQLTGTKNVFCTIRTQDNRKRGEVVLLDGKQRAFLDSNKSPTDAFIWAHGIKRNQYQDVQFNHLWSTPGDVGAYTNLANICLMPAFLSKLTDTNPHIQALLRYRAFGLFAGYHPSGTPKPKKPSAYDDLIWAEPLPFVPDLEVTYRRAMATKPKDHTTASARKIGWVFSAYKPDKSLPAS